MKDFDFDELDRAVNSVLATKDTKNTEDDQSSANTDAPQVAPQDPAAETAVPVVVNESSESTSVDVTSEDKGDPISVVDTSDDQEDEGTAISVTSTTSATEEPAPEEVSESSDESTSESESIDAPEELAQEAPEPEQAQNDEPELLEAPKPEEETVAVDTAALAAIPVKRGRFMDMVAPGTTTDGAKKTFPTRSGITLSPSADFSSQAEKEAEKPEEEKPEVVDPATPVVEGEVEPEVTTASKTPDDLVAEISTAANTDSTPSDTTPFIPDVPVEKRPLNNLSTPEESPSADEPTSETNEPASNAIDPTLTATIPKEFDKDIMAVESNETVGEHDETHPDVNVGETTNDTTEPAIAATTAEPHPMFDTSTLAHPSDMVGHHTSKFSWAIIGGSLFVVGAALGVLYFLYGQG